MKVGMEVTLTMTLYHKETMKELKIDKTYKREFDEGSKEYKEVCDLYREEIGFARVFNKKDEYDKLVLQLMARDAKQEMVKSMENIADVIKSIFKGNHKGYVEFCGYIINPVDFCAVCIDDVKANFYKN